MDPQPVVKEQKVADKVAEVKKSVTIADDTEVIPVKEIPKEDSVEPEEGLNNDNAASKANETSEEQPSRRARPVSARPPPPKVKKAEQVKEERVLYIAFIIL
jgi:hypothetical protein